MLLLIQLIVVLAVAVATSRLTVTSDSVYSLGKSDFGSTSSAICIKYDFTEDPLMNNARKSWYVWPDGTGKTAYDYSKSGGPLGM